MGAAMAAPLAMDAVGPLLSGGGSGSPKGKGSSGPSAQQIAMAEYEKNQGMLAGRTAYGGSGMGTSTNAALAMTGPQNQLAQSLVGSQIQDQQLQAQNLAQQLDTLGSAGTAAGTASLGGNTGGLTNQ